jgi:hypothetical protein
MKTRRVYLTSVFALFVLAAGTFLLHYVFLKHYYRPDKSTFNSVTEYLAYQAKVKPIKLVFGLLLPGSLISILACSLCALEHTATLKISTRTITTVIFLSILSFLLIVITFPI